MVHQEKIAEIIFFMCEMIKTLNQEISAIKWQKLKIFIILLSTAYDK